MAIFNSYVKLPEGSLETEETSSNYLRTFSQIGGSSQRHPKFGVSTFSIVFTLWLCQHSYWTWHIEIVDLPNLKMVIFHRNSGISHEKWWFSIEIVEFPMKNGDFP